MKRKIVVSLIAMVAIIAVAMFAGCVEPTPTPTPTPTPEKTAAPGDLTRTNTLPCTIEWKDNSANEDGFNIYIGGSCANCEKTTDWTKVASVGKDVTSYSWKESCCNVRECSCAMVRAYNEKGESPNSNIIMLAPVC